MGTMALRMKGKDKAGFTLLELITVMGIIVLMSLVVVGGYSSIMRMMAEMAGVSALRQAATTCRQHACVDGQEIYFYVTGPSSYILCRKGGTVTDRYAGTPEVRERSSYLKRLTSLDSSGVLWIRDKYTDLSSLEQKTFDNLPDNQLQTLFNNGTLKGLELIDLKTGDVGKIRYPPWFDEQKGVWAMGVKKRDGDSSFSPNAFAINNAYGWLLYSEQSLPAGYAFVRSQDSFFNDNDYPFKAFTYMPDGTAHNKPTSSSPDPIYIQELGTRKISTITVDMNGKIQSDY